MDPVAVLDQDFSTHYAAMPPYFWSKTGEFIRSGSPLGAAVFAVKGKQCKTEKALRALADSIEQGKFDGVY